MARRWLELPLLAKSGHRLFHLVMLSHPFPCEALRLGHLAGCHPLDDNLTTSHRPFMSPCGGKTEPHVGLYIVLRHAVAVAVDESEVVLGFGVALFGRFAIPLRRLDVVLCYARGGRGMTGSPWPAR